MGGTGLDGDTFKTEVLMDRYGIQINKTSRNTVLFMTNIGTTRSSVAYLIEVLVQIAKELDNQMEDASPMDRLAFDRRVKALTKDLPPLPDFSAFHERFRAGDGSGTPEGDIRAAFFLAYDEDNCDYFPLWGEALEKAMEAGASSSPPPSSSPIRRAFPSWCRDRSCHAMCSTSCASST